MPDTRQQDGTTDFGFARVAESSKAGQVKAVFDKVASRYDLMNDVLSFGLHRLWKRDTVRRAAVQPGMKVLDIAGGTGDLSLKFIPQAGESGDVWLTDINESMLDVGRARVREAGLHCHSALCDAEALPFADGAFDVVTVAFGLRNMTHKDRALREMLRVLKPGGRLLVLEFSRCWAILSPFYYIYSFWIMPRLGALLAGDAASYRYLAESIRMHPSQPVLAAMMRDAGFSEVSWRNYMMGICALHMGTRR